MGPTRCAFLSRLAQSGSAQLRGAAHLDQVRHGCGKKSQTSMAYRMAVVSLQKHVDLLHTVDTLYSYQSLDDALSIL
jgi:hypothetical protein